MTRHNKAAREYKGKANAEKNEFRQPKHRRGKIAEKRERRVADA